MSPGVNPLKDVETLGKKLGYTQLDKNFHNVSLGQGQEEVAEDAMENAARGDNLFRKSSPFSLTYFDFFRWALGDFAKYSFGENLAACFGKEN